jgi:hypothetical protein
MSETGEIDSGLRRAAVTHVATSVCTEIVQQHPQAGLHRRPLGLDPRGTKTLSKELFIDSIFGALDKDKAYYIALL